MFAGNRSVKLILSLYTGFLSNVVMGLLIQNLSVGYLSVELVDFYRNIKWNDFAINIQC